MTQAENRINSLTATKADKSYVLNLLQNFDVSVKGLTPSVNLNGQGANSSSLKVNCWINSPAFLLEWHLAYKWSGATEYTSTAPQNTSEFTISKPGVNSAHWSGNTITGITIKVKCRNPFLAEDWSKEVTLTDNEIEMFNFIDTGKIIEALVNDLAFQNTVASVIITNPGMTERMVNKINLQTQML
jgi:hypothetical protein